MAAAIYYWTDYTKYPYHILHSKKQQNENNNNDLIFNQPLNISTGEEKKNNLLPKQRQPHMKI
jgi:hypothetical protein